MTWNWKTPSLWQRLLAGLLIVGAASAIRMLFFGGLGRGIPYLIYYPTTMLAALYGGLATGALATALSSILAFFWIQQGKLSPPEWLAFLVFVGSCMAICIVCEMLRLAKKKTGSEYERAAEDLTSSELRYRRLFDHMSEGLAYCRMIFENGEPRDFVYLEVNVAFENLTGLRQVVGRKVSEVIPGIQKVDPQLIAAYGRVALTGTPEKFEVFVEALKMWFAVSVYSPEKGYFVAVFDVITQRKQAEEHLKQATNRLALAVRTGGVGIWDYDITNDRLSWDDQLYRLYGITKEMFGGAYEAWLAGVHPEDRARCDQEHQLALRGEKEFDAEFRVCWPDGSIHYIRGIGMVQRDATGKPVRMIGTNWDITAQKQEAAEKEKLREQLMQARQMESIGRLAGGVAHDFNNILMVIMGNAELCLMNIDAAHPLHKWLEEISKVALHAKTLTRQLLAFARKQIAVPKILDINAAIAAMLKLLPRLIGEDIAVVWRPCADVGLVNMDPSQIDQILTNLAINARDAIKGTGAITIQTAAAAFDQSYCDLHPDVTPGNYVLLAFGDTGCGMNRETLSHIFEPFFSTKEVGRGTGLGLATVYGIVKQNNGHIDVSSEPGQGTQFKIYLPYALDQSVQPVTKKTPDTTAVGGSETILLVEDEEPVRVITHDFLATLGYTVLAAESPGTALRLAAEHSGEIHLLLTDVIMPGMNGRDLSLHLEEIRPSVKCLFISGFSADVLTQRGILTDGLNFLPKPFSRDKLARKVREVLESASAQTM